MYSHLCYGRSIRPLCILEMDPGTYICPRARELDIARFVDYRSLLLPWASTEHTCVRTSTVRILSAKHFQ